jgi:hypothetical protein
VSASEAAWEYDSDLGIDFGWHSHGGDNLMGDCYIKNSGIYDRTPWVGVIRPSDMMLMYDEPDGEFLDIYNIAIEMDTP